MTALFDCPPAGLTTLQVRRIRRAVVEELGFTLSAGISWNKMLAKLASARFKPNKQTGKGHAVSDVFDML